MQIQIQITLYIGKYVIINKLKQNISDHNINIVYNISCYLNLFCSLYIYINILKIYIYIYTFN